MKFQVGAVAFPISADTGFSSIEVCDPAALALKRLIANVIEWAIGERYRALSVKPDAKSIAMAVTTNVEITSTDVQYKFPLLAVRQTGDAGAVTRAGRMGIDIPTNYMITYTLPPLSASEVERFQPLLYAAKTAVTIALMTGIDPTSDVNVFSESGIYRAQVAKFNYGTFGSADLIMPTLMMSVNVSERLVLGTIEYAGQEPFEGAIIQVDVDGANVVDTRSPVLAQVASPGSKVDPVIVTIAGLGATIDVRTSGPNGGWTRDGDVVSVFPPTGGWARGTTRLAIVSGSEQVSLGFYIQ